MKDSIDHSNGSYHLVVVDDDPLFTALLQRMLVDKGYTMHCFASGREVIDWLGQNQADLMLLDYRLKDMTAREIIDTLGGQKRIVPFILITGEGNERVAADMTKCGAEEYLIKDANLVHLLPVVVEQTITLLRQRKQFEEARRGYQENIDLYRDIFESASDAFFLLSSDGLVCQVNQKVVDIFEHDQEALAGMHFVELFHTDIKEHISGLIARVLQGQSGGIETLGIKKDGTVFDVEIKGSQVRRGANLALLFIVRDISERKWAEEELKLTNQQLRVSEQAVRERERRLRAIFQGSAVGIVLYDQEGKTIESNHFYQRLIGYSSVELRSIPFTDYLHPEDQIASRSIFNDLTRGKCSYYQIEQRFISRLGMICWVRVTASFIRGESGYPDYIIHIVEDISERKQAEESLKRNEKKYRLLFENMMDGFAYHQLLLDAGGKPNDYAYLEINDAFEKLTGLDRGEIIGKKRSELIDIMPDDTFDWHELYGQTALAGEVFRFEKYSDMLKKWFLISAYSPVKGFFATIIEDITHRRQIEEELREFTSELETSNRDLENFTRLLSDDLQGQLETICQSAHWIDQDCGQALPTGSQERLRGIVERSGKISRMLKDIMVCARLSYHGMPFEPVDLNEVADEVIGRYGTHLKTIGAEIKKDQLPVIYGDRMQLCQMFERLFDNAIQYRSDQNLVIELNSQTGTDAWEVWFKDNGCGIHRDHHERVFELFYRGNDKSDSTGVGLSVVKKIIERHGGHVRLKSAPGEGTALCMTFPL